MREVAATVNETGLDPWMSAASAERQQWAAQFAAIASPAGDSAASSQENLEGMLDALLAAAGQQPEKEPC
jgi:hypothetical protein